MESATGSSSSRQPLTARRVRAGDQSPPTRRRLTMRCGPATGRSTSSRTLPASRLTYARDANHGGRSVGVGRVDSRPAFDLDCAAAKERRRVGKRAPDAAAEPVDTQREWLVGAGRLPRLPRWHLLVSSPPSFRQSARVWRPDGVQRDEELITDRPGRRIARQYLQHRQPGAHRDCNLDYRARAPGPIVPDHRERRRIQCRAFPRSQCAGC